MNVEFVDFPKDIINEIVSLLDAESVIRFFATSKFFRNQPAYPIIKKIYLELVEKFFPSVNPIDAVVGLQTHGDYIKAITALHEYCQIYTLNSTSYLVEPNESFKKDPSDTKNFFDAHEKHPVFGFFKAAILIDQLPSYFYRETKKNPKTGKSDITMWFYRGENCTNNFFHRQRDNYVNGIIKILEEIAEFNPHAYWFLLELGGNKQHTQYFSSKILGKFEMKAIEYIKAGLKRCIKMGEEVTEEAIEKLAIEVHTLYPLHPLYDPKKKSTAKKKSIDYHYNMIRFHRYAPLAINSMTNIQLKYMNPLFKKDFINNWITLSSNQEESIKGLLDTKLIFDEKWHTLYQIYINPLYRRDVLKYLDGYWGNPITRSFPKILSTSFYGKKIFTYLKNILDKIDLEEINPQSNDNQNWKKKSMTLYHTSILTTHIHHFYLTNEDSNFSYPKKEHRSNILQSLFSFMTEKDFLFYSSFSQQVQEVERTKYSIINYFFFPKIMLRAQEKILPNDSWKKSLHKWMSAKKGIIPSEVFTFYNFLSHFPLDFPFFDTLQTYCETKKNDDDCDVDYNYDDFMLFGQMIMECMIFFGIKDANEQIKKFLPYFAIMAKRNGEFIPHKTEFYIFFSWISKNWKEQEINQYINLPSEIRYIYGTFCSLLHNNFLLDEKYGLSKTESLFDYNFLEAYKKFLLETSTEITLIIQHRKFQDDPIWQKTVIMPLLDQTLLQYKAQVEFENQQQFVLEQSIEIEQTKKRYPSSFSDYTLWNSPLCEDNDSNKKQRTENDLLKEMPDSDDELDKWDFFRKESL